MRNYQDRFGKVRTEREEEGERKLSNAVGKLGAPTFVALSFRQEGQEA